MTNLYDEILVDATGKFQDSVKADLLKSEFDWDQLIHLLLVEDSAVQDIFSSATLQLADLCNNAKNLHQSYVDLSENPEGEANVCMERD